MVLRCNLFPTSDSNGFCLWLCSTPLCINATTFFTHSWADGDVRLSYWELSHPTHAYECVSVIGCLSLFGEDAYKADGWEVDFLILGFWELSTLTSLLDAPVHSPTNSAGTCLPRPASVWVTPFLKTRGCFRCVRSSTSPCWNTDCVIQAEARMGSSVSSQTPGQPVSSIHLHPASCLHLLLDH